MKIFIDGVKQGVNGAFWGVNGSDQNRTKQERKNTYIATNA